MRRPFATPEVSKPAEFLPTYEASRDRRPLDHLLSMIATIVKIPFWFLLLVGWLFVVFIALRLIFQNMIYLFRVYLRAALYGGNTASASADLHNAVLFWFRGFIDLTRLVFLPTAGGHPSLVLGPTTLPVYVFTTVSMWLFVVCLLNVINGVTVDFNPLIDWVFSFFRDDS